MSNLDIHISSTRETMFAAIADTVVAKLADAVRVRGQGTLVVSGGKTPARLFDLLSAHDAPWERTTVTLSDERWVPTDSDESNEKLVRSRLLVGKASSANFVGLKTPAADPLAAEAAVHERLAAISRPFDLILLGMGADGHTASLIPGSEGLARALELNDPALARAVVPPSATGMGPRMTMTLRALLDARAILLIITDAEKRAVLERAAGGEDVLAMPVRAILHQRTVPMRVYWAA